jgi:hypothetical protein
MALVEKTNKPLSKGAGKGAAAQAPVVDDDDVFAAKENAVANPAKKSPKKKTVEETYQKLTQLEHVLLRPDTYIGSTEMNRTKLWVHDSEVGLNQRDVTYVPGMRPACPPPLAACRPPSAMCRPSRAARRCRLRDCLCRAEQACTRFSTRFSSMRRTTSSVTR